VLSKIKQNHKNNAKISVLPLIFYKKSNTIDLLWADAPICDNVYNF